MAGETDSENRALGEAIMVLRKRRGVSQKALTAQADLPSGSVSRFERAKGTPDINQLRAIAKAIGVDPGEILRLSQAILDFGPSAHSPDAGEADRIFSPDLHEEISKHAGERARLDGEHYRLLYRMLQELLRNERQNESGSD